MKTTFITESKGHDAAAELVARGAWWPDLFLRKGRRLQCITPEQCSAVMEIYRDGLGASEMKKPWIDLFDNAGEKIGRVSYNGRVWLGDGISKVEVPQAGCKTVAQQEAEGWKDCLPQKG